MDLISCSFCFNKKENVFSIHKEFLGKSLPVVIKSICGIQITSIEPLNFDICYDCAAALIQTEVIIQKCRNALSLLLENKVKQEEIEYHELQASKDSHTNESNSASELEETLIEIDTKVETSSEFPLCAIEPEVNSKYSAAEEDADASEEPTKSNKSKRKYTRKKEGPRVLKINCKANWHFKCELCSFETDFAAYYKNHLIDIHEIEKPKIFKCPHCIESYRMHASMQKHIAVVHEKKPRPPRARNILCSECGKKFPCRNSLKIHMHVHTKEPLPFQCTEGECRKTYASMASLKNHITSAHSNEKKFSCDICGNTFALIFHLRTHMSKCHMSNEMQDCPNCGRSYRSLEKFEKHIQSERCKNSVHPCQFPNCNKRFSRPRKMKLHMLHMHSGAVP